ncbi:MAG: hypothetical protein N2258_02635 [Brevinematales bacterium]|nr:hypothetical protein [Brevinematales bacterium]
MANETRKIKVEEIENEIIKKFLENEGFLFKDHQYAYFRAQKDGLTIILYENQTLLFQGDISLIDEYFLKLRKIISSQKINAGILGLDESGKGDIFGPLVLAGTIIKNPDKINDYEIEDSKNLNDEKIYIIFNKVKNDIIYKVRIIEPEEYNILYEKYNNINKLMTEEYKRLILSFEDKDYNKIILDKYSISIEDIKFLKNGISKPFEMYHKGERFIPVALASIVARYYFSEWFNNQKILLPKGTGEIAIKKFIELKNSLSEENLKKIAKVHFKIKV